MVQTLKYKKLQNEKSPTTGSHPPPLMYLNLCVFQESLFKKLYLKYSICLPASPLLPTPQKTLKQVRTKRSRNKVLLYSTSAAR